MQCPNVQCRIFTRIKGDAKVSTDEVEGTIRVFNFLAKVLINPSYTYSFIFYESVFCIGVNSCILDYRL